jgi:hypothetical protein
MTYTRVGKTEGKLMDSLQEHGGWRRGCGWIWDTHKGTERRLNRLVEKGFVQCTGGFYTIAPKGEKWLAQHDPRHKIV